MAAAKESIPATGPSIPNIRKFKGKLICKTLQQTFSTEITSGKRIYDDSGFWESRFEIRLAL